MKRHHSIESAVVNISFASEELAHEQQYDLEMFARNEMLGVVSEVFDELSADEAIYRIDKLEIDLGDIGLGFFYEDFANRLKQKIRESLGQDVNGALYYAGTHATAIERVPFAEAQFGALLEFLATGRVPWNASARFRSQFSVILEEVLRDHSEQFFAAIDAAAERQQILIRLASQLDSANFLALLAALLHTSKQQVQSLIDSALPVLRFGVSQFSRVAESVRAELLGGLLSTRKAQRDSGLALLLGELVRIAAQQSGRSRLEIFTDLFSSLRGTNGDKHSSILYAALDWVCQSAGLGIIEQERLLKLKRETQLSLAGRKPAEGETKALRRRLQVAIQSGVVTTLQAEWTDIVARYAVLLHEIVMIEGQRAEVRRTVAQRFPEPMIQDIVQVLEPAQHEFIESLVAEPKTLMGERQALQIEESQAKRALWEFTLTYLIVERGSRFNRKSYIASVSRQMAAHSNVTLCDLLASIVDLLRAARGDSTIKEELLSLLIELQQEQGATQSGSMSRTAKARPTKGVGAHQADRADAAQQAESELEKLTRAYGAGVSEAGESTTVTQKSDQDEWLLAQFFEAGTAFEETTWQLAKAALSSALERGKLAELQMQWPVLARSHRVWLRRILASRGQRAEIRHVIASSFSDPMLKDVVELLEPGEGSFIYETLHSRQLVSRRDNAEQRSRLRVGGRDAYVASWEFTLTYLLVERGSQFNKKSYLASVIGKLAARDNLDLASFYQMLLASFDSGRSENLLRQELVSLLVQLYREETGGEWVMASNTGNTLTVASLMPDADGRAWKRDLVREEARFGQGSHTSDTQQPDSEAWQSDLSGRPSEMEPLELIRAYLLFEKLTEAITHTSNQDGMVSYQVVRLLHELTEHYPWKLHRFNQELNSGRLSLRGIMLKLPRALQRKLVVAFFKSFARKYEFSLAEFERHLDRMSKTSASTPAAQMSYLQILNRLIGNTVSDIDAIFAPLGGEAQAEQVTAAELAQHERERDSTPELAEMIAARAVDENGSSSERLQAYLLGEQRAASYDRHSLTTTVELMLNSQPAELASIMKQLLTHKSASDRLVALLPESLLVKILLLLKPVDHFKAILYADLLTMACVEIGSRPRISLSLLHRSKWEFIYDFLIIRRQVFSEVSYVRQLTDLLYLQSSQHAVVGLSQKAQFYSRLTESVRSSSSASTHVSSVRIAMILGNLVSNADAKLAAAPVAPARTETGLSPRQQALFEAQQNERSQNSSADSAVEEEQSDILEDVFVENAGLVLLSPYLPRYFAMLDLMDGRKFKSREHAERGVHLLQYLLNESTENFEYQLVLNKVLCGIKAGIPICKGIAIEEKEVECSKNLLKGVLQNWPTLKNTSVEGLRESFLQRDAHLQLKDDAWHLQVESKAFDMLLDSVPWNYGTIKHPWMDKPVYVHWR